jgi:hypothetical protein
MLALTFAYPVAAHDHRWQLSGKPHRLSGTASSGRPLDVDKEIWIDEGRRGLAPSSLNPDQTIGRRIFSSRSRKACRHREPYRLRLRRVTDPVRRRWSPGSSFGRCSPKLTPAGGDGQYRKSIAHQDLGRARQMVSALPAANRVLRSDSDDPGGSRSGSRQDLADRCGSVDRESGGGLCGSA